VEAERIAVVLADDHVVVRRGLSMMLDRLPDIDVVAEVGDADAALAAVRANRTDVLVLDLNMPGRPSLDALGELVAGMPGLGVVMLTMEQDATLARRALDLGARGYVLKQAAEDELVEGIRTVAAGGRCVSAAVDAALRAGPQADGSPDGLTERELEVLRLIALGHTNPEIAAQLGISVRTVESHRTHVQHKAGVSSRAELVRYALDLGLM
jgi:two-component system response regulator NreC